MKSRVQNFSKRQEKTLPGSDLEVPLFARLGLRVAVEVDGLVVGVRLVHLRWRGLFAVVVVTFVLLGALLGRHR